LKFDSPEGKYVFWHSSAHILGQAMEKLYGCNLCVGPPLDEGFFYEAQMNKSVLAEDFEILNQIISKILSEKQPFERLTIPKDIALEMFKYNPYKSQILKEKVPEGGTCTIYRCGTLIDPCRGPHLPNTNRVKGFLVTKNSSSYWKGKAENDLLQRIYAISFPDKKMLEEWRKFQEEAAARDHRLIGKNQELFFFHPVSPGSCFFLPHGARIYNKLIEFIRSEYRKRGFTEVVTPNTYMSDLWITSGHWQKYKENMFIFKCEDQEFGLKPMNCPGHCLMFSHRLRSYRELPIRFADFGVLHRNELSGALTGLTRVRRFQQDDAHIFCSTDQIKSEIEGALDFMSHVYGIFGFEFNLELSTRPENFIGEIEMWNKAEKELAEVLDDWKLKTGKSWKLNPGDGAFYGPKIDIHIFDALKRSHQCATIQLDFQLPIRFNLEYVESNENTIARPVIIHRAILGSVERMIAILIEHTAGKWPFWLSPRQVAIVPVSEKYNDYANEVKQKIHDAGFYVDSELSDKSLAKKIRELQLAQYNYILVVGEKEKEEKTVNVRTRDNIVHGTKKIEEIINEFHQLVKEFK
jgi:threonyl-tRNA synthetase